MNSLSTRIAAFVLSLLLAVGLSAFAAGESEQTGGAAEEPVTLTVWTMRTVSSQVENLRKDLDEFEAANPGVTVELESVSYDTVYQRLLTGGRSGEVPDVFNAIEAQVAFMQARDQLAPVDSVLEELGKDNFVQSYLTWVERDGHYWALPDWALHEGLYYRKSLLQDAGLDVPETWDELLEAARALNIDSDGDGTIDSHGMGIPLHKRMVAQQTLGAIMYSNDVHIFDPETGEYQFGDKREGFIESMNFLVTLYEEASPEASLNWSWGDYRNAFVQGVTNMTVGWGAPVLIAMEDNPDMLDDIAVAPFPSGPAVSTYPPPSQFGGAYFFTLADNGPQRFEAAKKLLTHLFEEERVAARANTRPIFALPAYKPSLERYYNYDIPSQFEDVIQTIEQDIMPYEHRHGLEGGLNPVAGEIEASDIFGEAIHNVIVNDWSADRAFNWLDEQLQEIIAQVEE